MPHKPERPINAPFNPTSPSSKVTLCPRCRSPDTQHKNLAKNLGAMLGGVVSLIQTLSIAPISQPTLKNISLSPLASLLMTALSKSAAGCLTGSAIGQTIDKNYLNNYRCRRCNHTFQHSHHPSGDQHTWHT